MAYALRYLLLFYSLFCGIRYKFTPKHYQTARTMSKEITIQSEFIRQAIQHMELNLPRIEKCLKQLSEEQVWQQPNKSSNSIANLILHVCGNVTQYIISGLGKNPDHRERDLEFSTREGYTKQELWEKIKQVVEKANSIMAQADEAALVTVLSVQGFEYSGIGIIMHVVEHFSYHTGQIAYWTKFLQDQDLGFYADFDLNIHNK